MEFGKIFWWIFLAIMAFLILSRKDAATAVLNSAGNRFIETIGVLQGRDVNSGTGNSRIGGIAK